MNHLLALALLGALLSSAGCASRAPSPPVTPASPVPAPPAGLKAARRPTPGCAARAPLPDGEATIEVQGTTRRYRIRLPRNYAGGGPWPLVLALHPNGNAGFGYWDADGGKRPLRARLADEAVLVVPLGRSKGADDKGKEQFDWRGDVPADLAFFDALLTRLKEGLCLDENRLFSMGFSGGGSFSAVLGCHRKDIRAFAAGGAVSYFDPAACQGTPAAWITIGKGELTDKRIALRDFWRTRAGCQPEERPTEPAPCVAYRCPGRTPVTYCEHAAGHEWPDFGTSAAWAFFARF